MHKATLSRLFLFLLSLSFIVSCQDEEVGETPNCETNRYKQAFFSEFEKTPDVEYGKAINGNGILQSLYMDIFQPKNDPSSERRPLLLWVHGGHFISGSKADLEGLASVTALRGFVSASINYRLYNILSGIPDTADVYDIVVKSTQDISNAVTYFLKDARGTNLYNIDTTKIFLGGVSAGAIAVLHTTYLDPDDVLTPLTKTAIDANGGFDAFPNIRNYIQGVINLSGAIIDPAIIESGDPALYSFHGNKDNTVPIGKGFVGSEELKLVEMYGSRSIHDRAKQVGVSSIFVEVDGGGHSDIYLENRFLEARTAFDVVSYDGMKQQICQ